MTTRFPKALYLPLALLVLHTLLVEAVVWIELNNAWSDQNATMLVMVGLGFFDAPVIAMLDNVVSQNQQPGTFYFLLKLFGGGFWFAVGLLVSFAAISFTGGAVPQTRGRAVH